MSETLPEANGSLNGICYCQDRSCDKIFPASFGIPHGIGDGLPTLPRGHKLKSVVFTAKALRRDAEAAEKLHELQTRPRRSRYDDDDYLDTSDDLK